MKTLRSIFINFIVEPFIREFFPTRITPFGRKLFIITWENDYYARKARHGYKFWEQGKTRLLEK